MEAFFVCCVPEPYIHSIQQSGLKKDVPYDPIRKKKAMQDSILNAREEKIRTGKNPANRTSFNDPPFPIAQQKQPAPKILFSHTSIILYLSLFCKYSNV